MPYSPSPIHFLKTFYFILEYSQLTILLQFQWTPQGLSQTYTCIHSPPKFPFHPGCHITLSRVPREKQANFPSVGCYCSISVQISYIFGHTDLISNVLTLPWFPPILGEVSDKLYLSVDNVIHYYSQRCLYFNHGSQE